MDYVSGLVLGSDKSILVQWSHHCMNGCKFLLKEVVFKGAVNAKEQSEREY